MERVLMKLRPRNWIGDWSAYSHYYSCTSDSTFSWQAYTQSPTAEEPTLSKGVLTQTSKIGPSPIFTQSSASFTNQAQPTCLQDCVAPISYNSLPLPSERPPKVSLDTIEFTTSHTIRSTPQAKDVTCSASTTSDLSRANLSPLLSPSATRKDSIVAETKISTSTLVTKSASKSSSSSIFPITTTSTIPPNPASQETPDGSLPSLSLPATTPTTSPRPGPGRGETGPRTFLSGLSNSAKAGAIIGLILLFIFISISAILFFRRWSRRSRILAVRRSNHSTPSISASYFPVLSRMDDRNDEDPLLIYAGEARESLSVDASGVKWPENVLLKGDAKEFFEAGEIYKREMDEKKRLLGRGEGGRLYTGQWF